MHVRRCLFVIETRDAVDAEAVAVDTAAWERRPASTLFAAGSSKHATRHGSDDGSSQEDTRRTRRAPVDTRANRRANPNRQEEDSRCRTTTRTVACSVLTRRRTVPAYQLRRTSIDQDYLITYLLFDMRNDVILEFRAGLTIVPVVPWQWPPTASPRPRSTDNCQIFTMLFWRLNGQCRLKRLDDDWKRSSTFWGKKYTPEKILATRMRKGPRLTLVWAPEWLIRPCLNWRSYYIALLFGGFRLRDMLHSGSHFL